MPVIKLWCLPKCNEEKLRLIFSGIVRTVASIHELCLKDEKDMTILFPPDQMAYGLGTEIIIEVTGLFERPERDEKVRQRLARDLGGYVLSVFPRSKIECFIYPFNPAQGFWASAKAVNPYRANRQFERIGLLRIGKNPGDIKQ